MTGNVVTFYSYKGGVGRSFALANIAVLLARWGYRVLTIDWDLEAPGLHEYFAPLMTDRPVAGVVDLVDDFTTGAAPPASGYVTRLDSGEPGALDLIAAGRRDSTYVGRVQAIDWALLYERGLADHLERFRKEWITNYDFVLIDSRTGISDIAGICTAHLPDRLVLAFTANEQSVTGAVDMVGRADAARDRMPYDRPQLVVLPLLSRLDSRVEYKRAEQWYQRCTSLTAPLFRNWLVQTVSEAQMLRHLTLPYVSYWTFGEQLPVREERTPSAEQISFALETVAAIIAHRFDRTDLLADNRDAYVAAARSPQRGFTADIRVSCPRSALPVATALTRELEALGARAKLSLSGDPGLLNKTQDRARHMCLVIDGQVSRWQAAEAEQFLRHTLEAQGDRRLFPVLTRTVEPGTLPGFLRNLQHFRLGPPREVARKLYAQAGGKESEPPTKQAYRDAVVALHEIEESLLHHARWILIEQTLRDMAHALKDGDTDSLRDLTLDLELAGRVHQATNDQVVAPDAVVEAVAGLLRRIDGHVEPS